MSESARKPIIVTWLVTLVVVAVGFGGANVLIPRETAFESGILAELDRVSATDPAKTRVVVLGDSFVKSATRHPPTFEERLRSAGADVEVANLSAGGRVFDSYTNLLPDIQALNPDVVILQASAFLSRNDTDPELRDYVRRLVNPPDTTLLFGPVCKARGEPLQQLVDRTQTRYSPELDAFGRVSEFIIAAQSQGIEVYLLSTPWSTSLDEHVGAAIDAFEQRLADALDSHPNMTMGPDITVGGDEFYCDFAHLNPGGQQEFLDQFVPEFLDYLEEHGAP